LGKNEEKIHTEHNTINYLTQIIKSGMNKKLKYNYKAYYFNISAKEKNSLLEISMYLQTSQKHIWLRH
jgi:hypothetical protein